MTFTLWEPAIMDKIGQGPDRASSARETFRMVPDKLWLDERLEHVDVRVWCGLAFLARGRPECDATDAIIAKTVRVSDRTIRRSLDRLEDGGYVMRLRGGQGGRLLKLRPEGDDRPAFKLTVVG